MDIVLHYVAHNAVMATVLALVVAGVATFIRHPALVHALWVLVLLKLVIPPLIEVPVWTDTASLGTQGQQLPEGGVDLTLLDASPRAGSASFRAPGAPVPAPGSEQPAHPQDLGLSATWDRTLGSFRWREIGLSIAVVGSLLWFLHAGIRVRRFQRLLSTAYPASGELADRVQRCATGLGLARPPEAILLPIATSPMIWGIGRQTRLVLPQELVDSLAPEQLAGVLTHELAHLRRRDHWVRLLELVVTGLFWWHPVVWWARHQLHQAEEEACDAWVVSTSPGVGPTYAGALLQTFDYLAARRAVASPLASGMGHASLVKRRLVMIMNENTPQVLSGRCRLAFLVLAALFLPLTLVRASAVDVPSLEEIKRGLTERHHKVQSLYVETVSETSSPFSLEDLVRLPDDVLDDCYWLPGSPKVEYRYAFHGEKRYARVIRDIDTATPALRASVRGRWPRWSFEDTIRAYNGKFVWDRHSWKEMHQDGHVEDNVRGVHELPPEGLMRFCYPPEYHAMNLGVAIAGPDITTEDPWDDLFYYDVPDLRERWALAASGEVKEVDAAACVVLSGTIDMTFAAETGARNHVRAVKLWLDIDRGLALRKWEETDSPGKEPLHRMVNSRFKEVEPGLWLPQETVLQTIAPSETEAYPEQFRGKLMLSTRIKVTKWIVNRVPADVFEPLVKPGDYYLRAEPAPPKD